MAFARIMGTGSYLPDRVLTNRELSQSLDTSDDWIRSRSGMFTSTSSMKSSLAFFISSIIKTRTPASGFFS